MTKTSKWTVIFTDHAEKAFAKLDRSVKKEIEDNELVIVIVRVAHRREVYILH